MIQNHEAQGPETVTLSEPNVHHETRVFNLVLADTTLVEANLGIFGYNLLATLGIPDRRDDTGEMQRQKFYVFQSVEAAPPFKTAMRNYPHIDIEPETVAEGTLIIVDNNSLVMMRELAELTPRDADDKRRQGILQNIWVAYLNPSDKQKITIGRDEALSIFGSLFYRGPDSSYSTKQHCYVGYNEQGIPEVTDQSSYGTQVTRRVVRNQSDKLEG